jgi:hypothetical protein
MTRITKKKTEVAMDATEMNKNRIEREQHT